MESEKPAKIKKAMALPIERKLSLLRKVLFFEVVLFLATMALGITVALRLIHFRQEQWLPPATPVPFLNFIIALALATLFIFLIIFVCKKKRSKAVIFKSLFALVIFLGGISVLVLWFGDLSLVLITLLIIGWLKYPSPLLHNLCLILAMAGLGATLGLSLTPQMIVVFLVLFSIYDFIAVYKTKHMIKMAKEMIKGGAILGFVVPQKFSDFTLSLKEVKVGGKFLILGGGDVVFPLLLVVSLLPQSIFASLIIAFFALIGLIFSFLIFISQKIHAPIPALPPIALFSILGYLLVILLNW